MDTIMIWQLPVTDNETIHKRAKVHCFVEGVSLCGRHSQNINYYETDINISEILLNPKIACCKCMKKSKNK
jgi:hypothetical protein